MKIGIAAPLSIAAVNGGVRTQVLQTAKYLRLLGLDVEFIHFDQEYFDYDLVHVFSASPETIGISKQAKEAGIKLVISPVFYSNRSASTIATSLKIEKAVSRMGSGIRSDFGIKSEICNWADAVLPNTRSELELVRDGLRVDERLLSVIPNGVESRFANAEPELFKKTYGITDFILFVGQAGTPRKNVIQLLKVASEVDQQIVVIGDFYDNEYSKECLQIASKTKNVLLIETLHHTSSLLESAYAACSIFCLPSMYETPGIAAMEASLAGAKVIITQHGGTKEYFGKHATYVNPKDDSNLKETISSTIADDQSSDLKKHILENYTWEIIAQKTAMIYSEIS